MLPAAALAVAVLAGWLARCIRLPGGAIVGSMIATAVVSLTVGDILVPEAARITLFVGLGTMIGTLVTRPILRRLPAVATKAVGAAVLIIAAGIAIAFLLRPFGMAPDGDVLATSPGALSVLSAAALEHGLDAPTVALFHVVRIILILLTLPLLVTLLARDRRHPTAEAPSDTQQVSRHGSRSRDLVLLLLVAAAATTGGLLATFLGIAGGLVVGTTLGAAIVSVSLRRPLHRPAWLPFVVQSGLGWLIGSLVTTETVRALQEALLPSVLAAVLIIGAGIVIAMLMRAAGIGPTGYVLATSPGAVEVLASLAEEHDAGAVEVAVFHTVRLVLVILSLPLLLMLA